MTSSFFSILVPVYKNVRYLKECLDSILSQSFGDFEIILCYQGETKNNLSYCDERIKEIYLEKPSLYRARIESYKVAQGEYVIFIDSDDMLFPDSLRSLYAIINASHFRDIYQFEFTQKLKTNQANHNDSCFNVCSKQEYLSYFLSELGTYPIVRKCCKRKDISFYDEDIIMAEDGLLSLAFIENSESIVITNNVYYFYRPNPKSVTTNLRSSYIDDLSIFLLHTMQYRTQEKEINMLIYSYISMFFTFAYSLNTTEFIGFDNVKKMINKLDCYKFNSRPRFITRLFKKLSHGNYKKIPGLLKFGLFLFKIMKKIKISFKIILR